MTQRNELGAIVLTGGRGSRLGHAVKGSLRIGESGLLARMLDMLDGIPTVVVGDDPVPGHVVRVREDPPYAGPAAGVAAGIEHIAAEHVLVLAVDLPFASRAVSRLIDAPGAGDGVIAVDPDRRQQYLLSRVRRESLQSALAQRTSWAHASVRQLFGPLTLRPVEFDARTVFDIDTWDDLQQARTWAGADDGMEDKKTP